MTAIVRNDLEIYDTHADRWWDGSERWLRILHNMVPARLRFFEQVVGDFADTKVLDLGCGGGFLSEALARRGAIMTGIDPATRAIDAARSHAEAGDLDIAYTEGVGECLPFPDNSFDHVVCVDVLEHVMSVERTLCEVARVLRPGGHFLFDTINRNLLSRLAVVTIGEGVLRLLPKGTHDPAMFIKPAELVEMLSACGLTPGRITGLGPTGINRSRDFTFGQVPFRGIIYMGTAQAQEPGA